MSYSLPNTLNKCGECAGDFYGAHLKGCTKEEALEVCSICDQWYINSSSPFVKACKCEIKVAQVICGDCLRSDCKGCEQ